MSLVGLCDVYPINILSIAYGHRLSFYGFSCVFSVVAIYERRQCCNTISSAAYE